MKFYKIVSITCFGVRRISFCADSERKLGWSTSKYFHKRQLVLEATRIEFQAYLRGRVSSAPPIRFEEEIIPCVPSIDGYDHVAVVHYIPNRHQRKHGITSAGFCTK